MFDRLKKRIRGLYNKVSGKTTLNDVLRIRAAVSPLTQQLIKLWCDMYADNAPWLKEPSAKDPERITSRGLPAFIAREKARMAVLEFKSEITTPKIKTDQLDENGVQIEVVDGSTERAEFLNENYQQKVIKKLDNVTEYLVAEGGFVIKPYIVVSGDNEKPVYTMQFDFVHANMFIPLGFDNTNEFTDAAFIQMKTTDKAVYYRLERHALGNNSVTITNTAYKNENATGVKISDDNSIELGRQIPLTDVPEWASLSPSSTVNGVDQLLFQYFKMPGANNIDPTSPLGVSGYSRAVKQIRDADMQYSTYLWEFEGGSLGIDVDRDALKVYEGSDGNDYEVMNTRQRRLYNKVDLGSEGDTWNVFNPTLRDENYKNGLQTIEQRIEDICGLSRGTITEASEEARTATELKIQKQRSFAANAELQQALEDGLRGLVNIMDIYATIYNVVGDVVTLPDGTVNADNKGKYEISFDWDDSIIVDRETELQQRRDLMHDGIIGEVEQRMWWTGETEAQAVAALEKIRKEKLKRAKDRMQTGFGDDI